jgi:hypothetical protein
MLSIRILLTLCILLLVSTSSTLGAAINPPDLLSPRLADCTGTCVGGNVRWGDASVDGQVVVFVSGSNMLVEGDANQSADIFVWQADAVQRVSTGTGGEESNKSSDVAALSGNGRFVYFRGFAGNLVPSTMSGRANLYVKELATGRLALISRDLEGMPANLDNLSENFGQIDADFSGRYVVFGSKFAKFVEGVTDINHAQDIFLADLDSDGNGNYFDTHAQIHLLSATADGSVPGNFSSSSPLFRQDGRAVIWLTRATDLAPGLDSNNSTPDVLLAHLQIHEDGTLDPTMRTLFAINRMGDGVATLTPQGARLARLDPWRDIVAFVTADNIPGTGDNHVGDDVYLSVGSPGNLADRHLIWISQDKPATELEALDLAWDPLLPPSVTSQAAWIAHSEARAIDDLLLHRSAPFYPEGWTTVNWVEAETPSSAPVEGGGLSADGRYAFWATIESYGLEGMPATNLFRRQIAPSHSVSLTIHAVDATNHLTPVQTSLAGSTLYSTTTLVNLTPAPAVGYRFRDWVGVDAQNGESATVAVYAERIITATFDPMTPPIAANLTLTTAEDSPLAGIALTISDPDPDESHSVTLTLAPSHGTVIMQGNIATYQPASNFNGQDHFALQVTDAYGLQLAAPAQVAVQVTAVNDPPTAAHATGSGVNESMAIPVEVTVEDADADDAYILQIETLPLSGTVSLAPQLQATGHFDYIPNIGFSGVDSFTFRVTDSGNSSLVASALVTVTLPTIIPTPTLPNHLLLPTLRR